VSGEDPAGKLLEQGPKADCTTPRNWVWRGGSITMNDRIVSSAGKSSTNIPSALLKLSG